MKTDAGKTKAQLIEELDRLRQHVARLEAPQGAPERSAVSLHRSEERYRLLFETNGSFTVCVAPDFRILEFNQEAERLSGWQREEVLGQDYRRLILPKADWNAAEAAMDQLFAGTPIRNFEHCICTKTGEKRTLLWNVTRLLDPAGYPIQLIATGQDITEHKRIQAALQTSEERYRITSQSISDFAFSYQVSPDGSYLMEWLTDSFTKLTGFAVEELVGKPNILGSYIHPDDLKRVVEVIQTLKPGAVNLTELRLRTKSGGYRWVGSYSQTVVGKEEGSVQIYGACQDITERKRAEIARQHAHDNLERRVIERTVALARANDQLRAEITEREQAEKALRKSEEHYRAVVEDQTELICRFTPDTQLTFVNDAYCRYFDTSREDLLGRSFLPLLPEEERPAARAHAASLSTHPRLTSYEHTVLAANGEVRWIQWTGHALLDERGNVVECQWVGRDITQQKRLEEKLRAGENLIATGRMAAGVAHEINNPLAGIKNAFSLIKDAVPHNHPHFAFVGRIDKEIDRIADIMRQMYDLYRPQADVPHQFQIVPVMQDVLSLLSPDAQKYGVTLVLDPPSPLVQATLPESSLRQVLFNLIKNAIEASPPGQEVRITLACARDNLSLTVIDQGSGISADIHARIFEPFFSTKKEETYTGMGLGLSISYSLVQAMGGELTFESVPDEGTVFRMTLPLVTQANEITLNGEQALVPPGPSVPSGPSVSSGPSVNS